MADTYPYHLLADDGVWDQTSRSLASAVAADPLNPTPAQILADYFEERNDPGPREPSPFLKLLPAYHSMDQPVLQSDCELAAFFRQAAAHPHWHYPGDIGARRLQEMRNLVEQAHQQGGSLPSQDYTDPRPPQEPLGHRASSRVGYRLLASPLLETVARTLAVRPRFHSWSRLLTLRGGTLFFRSPLGFSLGQPCLTTENHPLLGGLLVTGGQGGSVQLTPRYADWLRGLILITQTAADQDFYVALLNRLSRLSTKRGPFLRYLEIHLLSGSRPTFWDACSPALLTMVDKGRYHGFPLRVALGARRPAPYYSDNRPPSATARTIEAAGLGSLQTNLSLVGGPSCLVDLPGGAPLYR